MRFSAAAFILSTLAASVFAAEHIIAVGKNGDLSYEPTRCDMRSSTLESCIQTGLSPAFRRLLVIPSGSNCAYALLCPGYLVLTLPSPAV